MLVRRQHGAIVDGMVGIVRFDEAVVGQIPRLTVGLKLAECAEDPRLVLQDERHSQGLIVVVNLGGPTDRKSTRLNSSHRCISYAVFCLKKKKKNIDDSI